MTTSFKIIYINLIDILIFLCYYCFDGKSVNNGLELPQTEVGLFGAIFLYIKAVINYRLLLRE